MIRWNVLYFRQMIGRCAKYADKKKLIFARWLMLKAIGTILKVSAKAGNGSYLVRKFIFHKIDVFLEYRAYRQQGYKVRIK